VQSLDAGTRRREARTVMPSSYRKTPPSVVRYLAVMSGVSVVFILLTREPKNNDLAAIWP
jgi:hypothetical protein